jgi:hypothetical protein
MDSCFPLNGAPILRQALEYGFSCDNIESQELAEKSIDRDHYPGPGEIHFRRRGIAPEIISISRNPYANRQVRHASDLCPRSRLHLSLFCSDVLSRYPTPNSALLRIRHAPWCHRLTH